MSDKPEVSGSPEVIANLHVSAPRRVIGIAMLVMVSLILLWIAFARPPEALGWRLFLLAMGGGGLWLSDLMRRATGTRLQLTSESLTDSEGRVLALVSDIRSVDRGTFAFKPSGGFLLRLRTAGPFAWAPGLWWRVGRRIGVGGATSRHEAKYMGEVLALMVEGDGGLPPRC